MAVDVSVDDDCCSCSDDNAVFSASDNCSFCCRLAVSSAKKNGVAVFVFVMAEMIAMRCFVLVANEVADVTLENA